MDIRTIPIADIQRAKYNPRKALKPGDPAYDRLKKAVTTFGLVEPLVWNKRSGNLVGGHQRLSVIEESGETQVDVSVVDLSDRDEKALNLALNKHSGEWDFATLADLVQELDSGDFDLEVTGFTAAELEKLATWTPDAGPKSVGHIGDFEYRVVVECANEQEQAALLDRFEKEGLACKAITS